MFKVLVVEDEKQEREALLDHLCRNFGREVELYEAGNGRNAVAIAMLRKADLVLMDIFLPGMSGITAAKKIKKQLPGIKIIFITAYDRFEYALDALRLGASDYILKPFPEETLVAAVRLALGQLEARDKYAENAPAPETLPECPSETDSAYDPHMAHMVMQMQEYMKHNYMNPISLDQIGEILKISPSYLSTQFKYYTHRKFVDYLTELRVKEASKLLLDPLRSTAEIASLTGFTDASYFSRVFKKRTGLSPSQYRRQRLRPSVINDDPEDIL